jgi:hypothetical protein
VVKTLIASPLANLLMRDALVLLIQQSHPWQSVTIGNDSLEVSVVMPCLDEAETVETCIRKAQCAIQRHNLSAEVIVADNGSTDGSQNIADRCGARVVTVLEKGYGSALKGGINASRGRFVIMGDADDSYDFSDLYPFVEKLREGYDLVMGTRLKGRIMPGAMPWLNRWLGNPVLTGIGRLFFACPVSDFHCGLRAFSKEAYHRMNLVTTGMEFASEMVVKASFLALRITEVPITCVGGEMPGDTCASCCFTAPVGCSWFQGRSSSYSEGCCVSGCCRALETWGESAWTSTRCLWAD